MQQQWLKNMHMNISFLTFKYLKQVVKSIAKEELSYSGVQYIVAILFFTEFYQQNVVKLTAWICKFYLGFTNRCGNVIWALHNYVVKAK